MNFSPFSIDANTPNPEAVGREKPYLTQVYHTDTEFPYNDFDYYNYQPTIEEEFVYVNNKESIIDNFSVENVSREEVYAPGDYNCVLSHNIKTPGKNEGFSILMNSFIFLRIGSLVLI